MNGKTEIVFSNGESSDVSNLLELTLQNIGYSKERIIHYTFLLENALEIWRKNLHSDARLVFGRRDIFNFVKISVELDGEKVNPFIIDLDNSKELPIEVMKDRLQSGVGSEIRYKYRHGKNCIYFVLPKKNTERNIFILNFLLLALPLAFQSVVGNVAQHIDALMLGFLDAASMSAVSIVAKFSTIFILSISGFTVAEVALLTQFWGKRDREAINKITSISLGFSFIFSSIFFIMTAFFPKYIMSLYTDIPELIDNGIVYMKTVSFSYFLIGIYQMLCCFMRSTGKVRSSVIYSVSGCAVNVALNAVFIFGLLGIPKMGVKGAALTTVISSALQVLLVVFELSKNKAVKLNLSGIFDAQILRLFVSKSWPVISQYLIWVVASNFVMAAFGHLGADVMAANSILLVIYGIFFSLQDGMGYAAAILVGNSLGKNKLEKAYYESVLSIKIGMICAIPLVILFCITGYLFRYMPFDLSDAALKYMNILTVIMSVNLFSCIMTGIINNSSLYAGGDTKFILFVDIIKMWGVMVPISLIAINCSWIPVVVFLIALNIDEIIATPFYFMRQRSRKWLKNLTH